MKAIDIIVIVIFCLIIVCLIAYFINKKRKGQLTQCDCCSSKSNLIKKYNKKYNKKNK